ncbi:MAG TPA: GAF and ANTAR domain-containing protein [Pseudonocardia sp.]|nr:GAF and ANTAR domain-containing protein [Pseudonocardia sp.]
MDDERRAWLWRAVSDRVSADHTDGWAHAVCLAAGLVLGVDATALTLHSTTGVQELLAVNDEWARTVVALRYSVGEGPGEEAYARGRPVLVPDVGVDQARWPGFAQAALVEGVGAVFAFPLVIGGIRLGMLELFRRRPGELSGSALADATVLTSLAIDAVLGDAETARREGRRWPSPTLSSQDVHIAIGMLAVQLQLSLEDAFARLRAHAYAEQRPILDVARDVLRRRIPLENLRD